MIVLKGVGLCMTSMKHRGWVAFGALSALALVVGGLAHAGAGRTRDDVWRELFARPDGSAGVPGLGQGNAERARLGAELFGDSRLSGDGTRSCASCHDAGKGFSNGAPRGLARDGTPLSRNVPALYDLAWGKAFMWDGRADTLEAQVRLPILAPDEMAGDFEQIARRLQADPDKVRGFEQAFGDRSIDEERIAAALAAFVRTLVSPETAFDRWVKGDDGALGPLEKEGFAIFVGEGGCVACHGGWRFTDDAFHDIGLDTDDQGRASAQEAGAGARIFKTPALRELTKSAPYMHDGSIADLGGVVAHYTGNLERRSTLDASIRRDLDLDDHQKKALVAFLTSLSSLP